MGVLHFAGLGKSAGAVTAGLCAIREQYGRHHSQYGNIAKALILFTSPEVASGEEKAFPVQHNEYNTTAVKKKWPQKHDNAVEIVAEFMEREFPETDVYLVTINVNDFSACFDAVGRAVLRFHKPGDVGKHIWANITGGVNLLNTATTQVAYLSGFIERTYFTFVADIRQHSGFLQPFSQDNSQFRYGEIYTFKTRFGKRHQFVLEALAQIDHAHPGGYIVSENLLSRLKSKAFNEFEGVDINAFKRDFLNVMQGIEQKGDRHRGQEDAIRLSLKGAKSWMLCNSSSFKHW